MTVQGLQSQSRYSCQTVGELLEPRGSKYPIFKDPGPKLPFRVGVLEQETSNIAYLDPLKNKHLGYAAPVLETWYFGLPSRC